MREFGVNLQKRDLRVFRTVQVSPNTISKLGKVHLEFPFQVLVLYFFPVLKLSIADEELRQAYIDNVRCWALSRLYRLRCLYVADCPTFDLSGTNSYRLNR
jgi:hypothetical protein